MKILKNVGPVVKVVYALKYLQAYKVRIFLARKNGDAEEERIYILKAMTTWGQKLTEFFDVKVEVLGHENLPDKGPVVFASNHQGYGDIVVLCAVLDKFQMGFLAKAQLAKLPLYGKWVKRVRSVFIQREDSRESLRAIQEGMSFLEQGYSMTVFPEGTRSKDLEVHEFKKGSLRLATKTGVPVIPIALDGTANLFEAQGYIKGGSKVTVSIMPPIETADMDRNTSARLAEIVEEQVREELHRLRNRSGQS